MKWEDEQFLILLTKLTKLLSELHDSHSCNFVMARNYYNGKQTHVCNKYHAPIKNVRWHCFDRFPGFSVEAMNEIAKQHKAGKCVLVWDGVAV
jgi:hypothetical protein